jgi:hypothetical protein
VTAPASLTVVLGILLPESVLRSEAFAIASAFVAINTVIYVALTTAKMLPKVYVSDWRRRRYERSETRSIHPDGPR